MSDTEPLSIAKNEILMVNIGSTATGAKVIAVKGDAAKLSLTGPACTEEGEKIALSRRIESKFAGSDEVQSKRC